MKIPTVEHLKQEKARFESRLEKCYVRHDNAEERWYGILGDASVPESDELYDLFQEEEDILREIIETVEDLLFEFESEELTDDERKELLNNSGYEQIGANRKKLSQIAVKIKETSESLDEHKEASRFRRYRSTTRTSKKKVSSGGRVVGWIVVIGLVIWALNACVD